MKRVLLDTNAYSFVAAKDKRIFDLVQAADIVYFSSIVIGELCAGFEGGSKKNENLQVLDSFLQDDKVELVDVSKETAKIYGRLFFKLVDLGKPLPTSDIWIAAQAFETNSTLITYDHHFLEIPKLKVWEELNK